MLVYIVLLLLILLTGVVCYALYGNTKRAASLFCNVTIILMICVQGFRASTVGEDTKTYILWFREYSDMRSVSDIFHMTRDVEVGYSLVNYLLSRITVSEQALIFVVSTIIVILHIKFIQKVSSNAFVSVIMFFGLNFFLTSMVSWRQFIAMGIIFWMYPLLLKKKYIRAVLVMILAFLFHDTSVIFGVLILLCSLIARFGKSSLFVLALGALAFIFIDSLIAIVLHFLPSYKLYFEGSVGAINFNIGKLRYLIIFLQLILIVLAVFIRNSGYYLPRSVKGAKYSQKQLALALNTNKRELTLLASLLSIGVVVGLLASRIPYAFRLSYYFDYFLIILIPMVIAKYFKGSQWLNLAVITASVILFLYYLSVNPGQTVPYSFGF